MQSHSQIKPIEPAQWISWILALVAGALSMTVFMFSTFETRAESSANDSKMEKRLDKIEQKLDLLIMQTSK